jgi:hypothetical protein
MGQKLDFNIEDAGIKVDGTQVIDSSRGYQGTVASSKLGSGTISADRLPYTITQTAPTNVGSTSSGHIWFVYSS